jgi:uncharacterized protein YunC (DUF1805 family)
MIEGGAIPLEPYPGSITPWRCQCLTCMRIVYPNYNSVAIKRQGPCVRCGYVKSSAKRTLPDVQCEVDGCDRLSGCKSHRMCNKHYLAWRKHGDPLGAKWTVERPRGQNNRSESCVFDGCDNKPHAREMCQGHWKQWSDGRDLTPLRERRRFIDGHKECPRCGVLKPASSYGKKNHMLAWECRSCVSVTGKAQRYGLTRDEALALCAVTECGACGADIDSSTRNHHIDHCHETGRVRGALCHGCNIALGNAKDDPAILRALAEYLERTRSAPAA